MDEPLRWSSPLAFDRYVVTGGGSGIGRGVALALANAGATVYVMGRRRDALKATVAQAATASGRIVPVPCDTREPELVEYAFSEVERDGGAAPGVVHAAAAMTFREAKDMSPTDFVEVIASTLFGGFFVVRRWAQPLIDSGTSGAAVVLTSSVAGRGCPGVAHSSAGKAGLESLVGALGREWGPFGLRLNAIGPGVFPVEKSERLWADESVRSRMEHAVALGRAGALHEIVGPIVFLMTEAAAYMTGETLHVDGGDRLVPWHISRDDIAAGLNNTY